ncbi:MAG TPA: histidine--tRNA ligase [Bacilli bacterium]
MKYQKPTGTQDLLPGKVEKWQYVENIARNICRRFNFKEIRTPIFEMTELFKRGVGETTDIVEKEMYTFQDKGDRSMTLRPEGTAGVVRAYVENKLYGESEISKLFYIGPMFRYERPQAGRYRQLHQFGVEVIGSADPSVDAEVIALGYLFYKEIGLQGVTVEINSVGNPTSRAAYSLEIRKFLAPIKEKLCSDCQSRYERNPMRILDCKEDQSYFHGAPSILDSLDLECSSHFEDVKFFLTEMGIDFVVNPRIVRGLDYYTQTAFEYKAQGIGTIDTVGGGGRYNSLVGQIGGEDQPGVGLGLGLERALILLEKQEVVIPQADSLFIYLASDTKKADKEITSLVFQLRSEHISADKDYKGRKIKNQFKSAERLGARYLAILGEKELLNGEISLKLTGSDQRETIRLEDFVAVMLNKLKGMEG